MWFSMETFEGGRGLQEEDDEFSKKVGRQAESDRKKHIMLPRKSGTGAGDGEKRMMFVQTRLETARNHTDMRN